MLSRAKNTIVCYWVHFM